MRVHDQLSPAKNWLVISAARLTVVPQHLFAFVIDEMGEYGVVLVDFSNRLPVQEQNQVATTFQSGSCGFVSYETDVPSEIYRCGR